MKTYCVALAILFFLNLPFGVAGRAADLNGLWTKTTSPDPNNIAIFYHEKNVVKAMGYSEIDGIKVVWHGEGEMKGKHLQCNYRHAENALPPGWAQEGVMELTLSHDGTEMNGTARATSGDWFGMVSFVRVHLFLFPRVEKWVKSDLRRNLDLFSGGRSSSPLPLSFDGQGQPGIPVLPKQEK